MAWLWWLGAALVLGVVEMLTVGFFFLMFVGGALAATLAALLGAPGWAQVVVFAVVSAVLLAAVRPAVRNWMRRSTPETVTNVHALVGREARVVLEVTGRGGRVKIGGEVWSARSVDGTHPVDSKVVVDAIDGAIAVVRAAPLTGR